jgi:hypothetical protein
MIRGAMKQSRRVEPRVPYPEDVSLIRTSGGKRIAARGVNISASGLYVHCVEPCEIGSHVVCSILLDGGPRKVRGQITRLEALPGMIGAAIAFSELTSRDLFALHEYVEQHRVESVEAKVHLMGMANPVRCQAIYDGDTIHLSTALPFLRLDSEVGVHLDASPAGETTSGVLSRISLDPTASDGVPRLALDVAVLSHRPGPLQPEGEAAGNAPTSEARSTRRERLSPAPLPSVVLSNTLQLETLVSARQAPLADEHPPRHDTAEVPRQWRFRDWSSPPVIHGDRPGLRRRRFVARDTRVPRWLGSWSTWPFWTSCVLALVFGFVTALILR